MCCRLIGSTWLCQSGQVEAHRRWRTVAPITREPSDGNYVPEIRYFKLLLRHGTCMNGDCCSMAPRLVPLSRSNRVALGGSLGLVQGMLLLCSKNLLNLALLKHMKRFRGPSICVTEAIGHGKQRLTRGIPRGLIEGRYPWKGHAVWYNAEPSDCNTIIPLPTKHGRVIVISLG